MKDPKTLLCTSKFPWARERISPKFVDNLDKHPQKGSPALIQEVSNVRTSDRTGFI